MHVTGSQRHSPSRWKNIAKTALLSAGFRNIRYAHTHTHTHVHRRKNTHIRKYTYTHAGITFYYTMHASLHRIELSTTTCHYNPLHWHHITLCDTASLCIYITFTLDHLMSHYIHIYTQRCAGNYVQYTCQVPVAKLPTGATSCNIGTRLRVPLSSLKA